LTPKVPKGAVDEAQDEIQQEQVDDVAEQLKRLGQELVAVADNEVARTVKLREVEAFLGKLQIKDFPELAESPVVQQFVGLLSSLTNLKPGESRNRGTLAEVVKDWTLREMHTEFEQVTFIPVISDDFTWNGVGPFRLVIGEEITVPKPIYDRYREVLYARKQANINEAYMLGHSDVPPDPNWQTPEAAGVRAWSIQGRRYGHQGGTLGTGRIYEGEAQEGANA
jgi:hypothetical protein